MSRPPASPSGGRPAPAPPETIKVAVVGGTDALPDRLRTAVGRRSGLDCLEDLARAEAVVYVAVAEDVEPNLEDAARIAEACVRSPALDHVVLVSSAAVYVPDHHHPGLVSEDYASRRDHPVAAAWRRLEELFKERLAPDGRARLTVLRPARVLRGEGGDFFSRLFKRRIALTVAGFDPPLQVLDADDLAEAVCRALEASPGGVFNVAPRGVVPLRHALRLSGSRRLPLPRFVQRLARALLGPLGLARPSHVLDYLRYPWTVSGERIRRELGFEPRLSSAEALLALRPTGGSGVAPEFDDFGMDPAYVDFYRRTQFRFLHDFYWRVETRGFEHVPRAGRAVLVGMHRGFMPFDGTMMLYDVVRETGRIPRFLIHPSLLKFPFLFDFMIRLGGILTCPANADRVLGRDGLLAVFPEGIQGAFTPYRRAHRLGKLGRDEFVRVALRNRAPIVPFVTLGSAEIFPILGRIDWRWWKRFTEWPYLPLTPTFPLLPLPLPSKWHTEVLPALAVHERYPPEAAHDRQVVRAISREVRERMQAALDAMCVRRCSIFFGDLFDREPAA